MENKKYDIKFIADSAGGITLQVITEKTPVHLHHYQKYYAADRLSILAYDVVSIENGARVTDWDGNEAGEQGWLSPTKETIESNCYRVFYMAHLRGRIDVPAEWKNFLELIEVYKQHA